MYVCLLSWFSHVRLFATLWTIAHQAPRSIGFSRQEYCSGLPFASPGDLPNPVIKPVSHVSCISRQVLYHYTTWEAIAIRSPKVDQYNNNNVKSVMGYII